MARSVFITGANRGIGLGFVKEFLSQRNPPTNIFATCRNPESAEELLSLAESNSSVKVLKLDVSDIDSFEKTKDEVEKHLHGSGLNILLNNAGTKINTDLQNVTPEAMMKCYKTNTVAPLMLVKTFYPLLKRAADQSSIKDFSIDKAAIVNITSKVGSVDDNKSGSRFAYRASKSALNQVNKSLSIDLKDDGIMAVLLHPGWVQTEMGGPNALITVEQSVQGMLNVLSKMDGESNGLMFDYSGKIIPW